MLPDLQSRSAPGSANLGYILDVRTLSEAFALFGSDQVLPVDDNEVSRTERMADVKKRTDYN